MSGAFGPAYGIQREHEDLAALVEHTSAEWPTAGHRWDPRCFGPNQA
jgi:hypothetical protein